MTELTAREVETAISEKDDYVWEEVAYYLDEGLTINGETYPVEVVAEYTGSEGDWDRDTFVVFKVGDQLFKKTGHYMSHYGNDWEGPLVEVEPYEHTVEDFREVTR